MANTEHKEKLFQDFYHAAKSTFEALESSYGITGVVSQIFGNTNIEQEAQEKLRGSSAAIGTGWPCRAGAACRWHFQR